MAKLLLTVDLLREWAQKFSPNDPKCAAFIKANRALQELSIALTGLPLTTPLPAELHYASAGPKQAPCIKLVIEDRNRREAARQASLARHNQLLADGRAIILNPADTGLAGGLDGQAPTSKE